MDGHCGGGWCGGGGGRGAGGQGWSLWWWLVEGRGKVEGG